MFIWTYNENVFPLGIVDKKKKRKEKKKKKKKKKETRIQNWLQLVSLKYS